MEGETLGQIGVDRCQRGQTLRFTPPVMSECTALLGRCWVSEGFQTMASACALHQPTICGFEYFYSQCPQFRT